MFKDRRARSAWRVFRMRAEWMLGSVSLAARREILGDLEAHVRDAMEVAREGDEWTRLKQALDRLGDPREFLQPLIAHAVLRRPRSANNAVLVWQALAISARDGMGAFAHALALVAAGAFGVALAVMSVARVISPRGAGVFWRGADEVQIRLLGLTPADGAQVLPVWGALFTLAAGAGLIAWASGRLRQLVFDMIMRSSNRYEE